ncbi:hypothetical protein VDGD_21767 [Verticillium dahliae]|nr:hypothetical protein VDGD_21767 [Verticillium dahliae]
MESFQLVGAVADLSAQDGRGVRLSAGSETELRDASEASRCGLEGGFAGAQKQVRT